MILASPRVPSTRLKLDKGISRDAAIQRFYSEHVGTGRSKQRDADLDRQFNAERVAPAVAKTEADLKLQKEWFKHPNQLDFQGIDTNPNKPARRRNPMRSRGLR